VTLKPAHLVRPEGRFTDKDGTLSEGEGKILADTVNALVDRTGGVTFASVRLPNYAKAALPSAAGVTGALIFVTDDAGGSVPAFSDGSSWRRVSDRNVIS